MTPYALAHPWLTFWLVVMLIGVLRAAVMAVVMLARMRLRAKVILAKGWPPPHLDADGDFAKLPLTSTSVN